MKKQLLLLWLLLPSALCTSQVGIGTETPRNGSVLDLTSTTKGFLPPRMTGLQKSEMNLSSDDIGMIVFQTDMPQAPLPPEPPGLYYFDGTEWIAPLANGAVNGQTLRWDGNKWAYATNLFNQGSSIGIGTVNPKKQLHLHSNSAPSTDLQLTSGTNNALTLDGLLVGISKDDNYAHVNQQENRPLWFGTNGTERMRIDSAGNIGIGMPRPEALLDVNGTVRIGSSGTILNDIMKQTVQVEVPALTSMGEGMVVIPFPDALEEASVYVSPGATMAGLMIGYARVTSPGNIEVKFMNMSDDMDEPMPLVLYVSVIQ